MNKSDKYGIIIKSIDKLNEINKRTFILKSIREPNNIVFHLTIIDKDMEARMKGSHINFLDYIPEFKVEVGDSYFWSNNLDPFDAAVGISGKDIPLEKKALLRCAWRILDVNKSWRQEVFKNHPELK